MPRCRRRSTCRSTPTPSRWSARGSGRWSTSPAARPTGRLGSPGPRWPARPARCRSSRSRSAPRPRPFRSSTVTMPGSPPSPPSRIRRSSWRCSPSTAARAPRWRHRSRRPFMQSISKSISILPPAEEKPQRLRFLSSIDLGLAISALLLAAIGLATVHSASAEMPIDYFPRQAAWVGIGLVLLIAAMSIDYHVLLDLSVVLYILGLVSLIAVLFIGVERGGAANWIQIGPWQFQPSEFAKLATALFIARYLASLNNRYLDLRQLLFTALPAGGALGRVAIEPDMGGAAMYTPLVGGMLLIAGIRMRWLLIAGAIVILLGATVWAAGMKPYQRQRVLTFLQPESDPLGAGYQVRQSKIAVGSGELLGKGYMQGTR